MRNKAKPVKVRPLISAERIRRRVRELAKEISRDYAGKEVLLVGLLKGSWVFLADLVRCLEVPVQVDFISAASYGSRKESKGLVRVDLDLRARVKGRDVLVVEDIVDTGFTLKSVLQRLKRRRPKSVRVCALLDKPSRRKVEVEPDYVGFKVPDRFIVGYGTDFAERFRQLPYVGYIEEEG
ncbi:MAG: hypoxanthine phosphoribosyltransferase [candidate division WOR-3 bacterium]